VTVSSDVKFRERSPFFLCLGTSKSPGQIFYGKSSENVCKPLPNAEIGDELQRILTQLCSYTVEYAVISLWLGYYDVEL
jgi:hypothetical protein